MRKFLILFVTVIAVLSFALELITLEHNGIEFYYAKEWLSLEPEDYEKAFIFNTVDGDTVKVTINFRGETVRLIGVDTPESVHPNKPVEYFGKAASVFTGRLLPIGERVLLTYDWNTRDKYGRLLAYVWFRAKYEKEEYWVLHNLVLIINGFGRAYTVFPFREDYMKIFLEAEQVARQRAFGLWGSYDEKEIIRALETNRYSPKALAEETSTESKTKTEHRPKVRIVYIKFSGSDEYVVIKNEGNTPVSLSGWRLFSRGGQQYFFPDITLQPGQVIEIHSGPQASGQYVWTKGYVWNNNGDEAILYDAQGNVVDKYTY